jgi:hypothetical protein
MPNCALMITAPGIFEKAETKVTNPEVPEVL